jgi:hypothetical protein
MVGALPEQEQGLMFVEQGEDQGIKRAMRSVFKLSNSTVVDFDKNYQPQVRKGGKLVAYYHI